MENDHFEQNDFPKNKTFYQVALKDKDTIVFPRQNASNHVSLDLERSIKDFDLRSGHMVTLFDIDGS